MREIEIRLSAAKDATDWELQVYDPNLASLIGQAGKKFDSLGHAEVWLEVFAVRQPSLDLGASFVIRGTAPAEGFDLEKILAG